MTLVDQAVLAQLNDFDAAVRRQAIIALGKSRDLAALPYLATVVRTDPDPELRELARKAGQYVRQNATTSSTGTPPEPAAPSPAAPRPAAPASAPPPAPAQPVPAFTVSPDDVLSSGYFSRPYSALEEEDAAAAAMLAGEGLDGLTRGDPDVARQAVTDKDAKRRMPVPGESYTVSAANQERAANIVESAMSSYINHDYARAMRYLNQALMTNPNLVNDDYFAKIASGVTGEARDQAIQMVIDQSERKTFIQSQQKSVRDERKAKHLGEARKSNWAGVGLDVLIYLLINFGGPLAIFFAIVEGSNLASPEMVAQLEDAGISLIGLGLAFYLPFVLMSALFSIVTLFIQAALIHVIAVYLLRGSGTFPDLLTRLLRLYNRYLGILFALLFVAVLATFVVEALALCLYLPIAGLSLLMTFKTFSVIGEAYDFGAAMGCLAVLITSLIIGAVWAVITYALSSALVQALAPMLPDLATLTP